MTQIPPAQRRQQRTERRGMPPPKRKRKKSKATIILSLIVCAAALALLVVICPWEPMSHATHSVGTADGNAQVGEHTNAYQGLRISEIMGSNHGSVPDDTGAYPDWVEIWNSSENDMDLAGVGLSDRGERLQDLQASRHIDGAHRLVGKNDARIVHYGTCNGDTLRLPAG